MAQARSIGEHVHRISIEHRNELDPPRLVLGHDGEYHVRRAGGVEPRLLRDRHCDLRQRRASRRRRGRARRALESRPWNSFPRDPLRRRLCFSRCTRSSCRSCAASRPRTGIARRSPGAGACGTSPRTSSTRASAVFRCSATTTAWRPKGPIADYRDLVGHLNRLNADWIRVARRFSPRVLVELLEASGPAVAKLLSALPPDGEAIFSVAWAGEDASKNWFDVGREYTEWWHHQAQIRDAVGSAPLDGASWLRPVIELSMYALRVTFAGADLPEKSAVAVRVSGDAGGSWSLVRTGRGWMLWRGEAECPALLAKLDADAAWRLFFNALPEEAARTRIAFEGDVALAERFLGARGVMV